MAPAPPNAPNAGDAPQRDTSVSPNPLEGPQRLITRDSIPVRTRPFTESSSPIRQQSRPRTKMPTTLSQTPQSSSRKLRTNLTQPPPSYARTNRQLQNALSNSLLDAENALRSTSARRSYGTGRLPPIAKRRQPLTMPPS
ncbi:hypothetical protein ACQRIU_001300 [Beauveria bassiana]